MENGINSIYIASKKTTSEKATYNSYTLYAIGEWWFVTGVSLSSVVPGSRLLRGKKMGVSFVPILGFLLCSNILVSVPEMASEP